jgi:hypothetical protein
MAKINRQKTNDFKIQTPKLKIPLDIRIITYINLVGILVTLYVLLRG